MNDLPREQLPAFLARMDAVRRPRFALMGEFSAGKSTLANLMIGTDPLPMQVVATQLPPVWISHGTGAPELIDLEGNAVACDLNKLHDIDAHTVAYIHFRCEEEILERCDIIDMPGISDPNMPSEVWERLMPAADGVIWCSAATQAWRQSEAAVWDTIDDTIRRNSMLLLTRADMLLTEKDRAKVFKRVASETTGLFAQTHLISLLEARLAVDDEEQWSSSGADDFVQGFLDLIENASGAGSAAKHPEVTESPEPVSPGAIQPRRPVARRKTRLPEALDPSSPESFTPKFS